jgi:hypothetical protein
MRDPAGSPGWPLLMDAATAARFVSMSASEFRTAVMVGLLPAGRTPAQLAGAGMLSADRAGALARLGPIWHRGEIESRAAHLFGLDATVAVAQSAARSTAREALDAYQPPRPRSAAARQGRSAG